MNDLVQVNNGVPMVDSVAVAKRFGKVHRDVMRAIRNLECPEDFMLRNFAQSSYEVRGHSYESYLMTKTGFCFLCMGFTGKEAAHWKVAYVNAFEAMERAIQQRTEGLEWKQARLQGKAARKSLTDLVKEFVEYAKEQGSSSAERYYMNITKMEYAALEMTEKGQATPRDLRDHLDMMDLGFLVAAEQVCKLALQEGMKRNLPYKEIYLLAKERVIRYADAIRAPRLS